MTFQGLNRVKNCMMLLKYYCNNDLFFSLFTTENVDHKIYKEIMNYDHKVTAPLRDLIENVVRYGNMVMFKEQSEYWLPCTTCNLMDASCNIIHIHISPFITSLHRTISIACMVLYLQMNTKKFYDINQNLYKVPQMPKDIYVDLRKH